MKVKIGVGIILASTVLLLAIVYLLVNQVGPKGRPEEANQLEAVIPSSKQNIQVSRKHTSNNINDNKSATNNNINNNNTDEEKKGIELDHDDIALIKSVAALSDNDLKKELNDLKDRIEKDELVEKLEQNNWSENEAKAGKKVLERYALLGLEETRREYLNVEPELKDPLVAHRDSLSDIRAMLENEDEDLDQDSE